MLVKKCESDTLREVIVALAESDIITKEQLASRLTEEPELIEAIWKGEFTEKGGINKYTIEGADDLNFITPSIIKYDIIYDDGISKHYEINFCYHEISNMDYFKFEAIQEFI